MNVRLSQYNNGNRKAVWTKNILLLYNYISIESRNRSVEKCMCTDISCGRSCFCCCIHSHAILGLTRIWEFKRRIETNWNETYSNCFSSPYFRKALLRHGLWQHKNGKNKHIGNVRRIVCTARCTNAPVPNKKNTIFDMSAAYSIVSGVCASRDEETFGRLITSGNVPDRIMAVGEDALLSPLYSATYRRIIIRML